MKRIAIISLLLSCFLSLTLPAMAANGSDYTVTMAADQTVLTGELVSVPVTVGSSGNARYYNAIDMVFSYDPTVLELSTDSLGGFSIIKTAGTVRIIGYGKDRAIGSASLNLTFRTISAGETKVTITSAKVDAADHAISADAPAATILDDATVITVGGYKVTLPADFTGEPSASPGMDYTFSKPKNAREYYIVVKINGTRVNYKDNGDGTYTISGDDITGPVIITAYMKANAGDSQGPRLPGVPIGGGTNAPNVNIDGLWITPYVELNGKTVFLIAVSGNPGKNMTYTFDGEPMYYTEKYTSPTAVIGEKVYMTLVIVEQGEALVQSEAAARISTIDVETGELIYGFDVNGSGNTDINDIKTVYDIYNGLYWGFDELPMQYFLNADINLDGAVNVEDAAAIVARMN